MEMYNNKERQQILKNNKLITTIYTNDENLFTLNTSSMKDIDYNINNIDLKLWHARIGYVTITVKIFIKFQKTTTFMEEKNDNINFEDYKISKLKKKNYSTK